MPNSARSLVAAAARLAAYDVKVLRSHEELIASFRLRHDVYGALGYLRDTNRSGLETDEHDAASIAFGALDGSGVLVGTLRLITPARASGARHRLPSMASDAVAREVADWNDGGLAVLELSRTIVAPAHRGAGVSRALMELGLAYAGLAGPCVLVGGCLPHHVPMYARYGYRTLPGLKLAPFESVGRVAVPVVCRSDSLPSPTREHVERVVDHLRKSSSDPLDLAPGIRLVQEQT